MDEARSIWHSLWLLLQVAWPTVALLLVGLTGSVVGARAAERRPQTGRIRALPRPAGRERWR